MSKQFETVSRPSLEALRTHHLHLFDPIYRGSRQYFDRLIISSLSRHFAKTKVVTRVDYNIPNQLTLGDKAISIKPCLRTRTGSWYETIANECASDIEAYISNIPLDKPATLFFCGINELGEHGLRSIKAALERLRNPPMLTLYFIEYQPSCLMHKNNRNSILKELALFARQVYVFVLDKCAKESLIHSGFSGIYPDNVRLDWLPDPPPVLKQEIPLSVRSKWIESAHSKSNNLIVLAVGKQSPRKGLFDLVRAARLFQSYEQSQPNKPIIFLSGSLDLGKDKNKSVTEQIKRIKSIVWRNSYVDDDEIMASYASADYILLPYDKSFEGSSGVFAYACLFGKPIISTDHGCIGDRVKRYSLGYTYASGDHAALSRILEDLPNRNSDEYSRLSKNCSLYADIFSIYAFKAALLKAVAPTIRERPAAFAQEFKPNRKAVLTKPNTTTPLSFRSL